MITSDAIAMPLSNTHFFRERIYASSVFFDHHGYLIQMTIVIPYKTYKIKDLETYFIRLSFSTSYLFPPLFPLEAGTHPKIVKKKKKQAIFQVHFVGWVFIRAWAFIRIFTVHTSPV